MGRAQGGPHGEGAVDKRRFAPQPGTTPTLPDSIASSEEFTARILREAFALKEPRLRREQLRALLVQKISAQRNGGVQVVSLVGGAGSGKTTLAQDLIRALSDIGLVADVISTDDYNIGDRAWRWERFEGDEVRDPMGKWDFDFMNAKIEAIRKGQVVKVPTYNQATGLAIDEGEESYTHEVVSVDVLIVEGDMFRVSNSDLTLYLDVSDEQRLQNRIDRDLRHRNGADSATVVSSFALRQRNQHIPYTLPAIRSADFVIGVDSTSEEWRYNVYQAK